MGSWGITMRESDYGLDLLGAIVDRQLKELDFSTFTVADALEVIKADIMEEIRLANRGCSATDLVFYFSENFPHNFTQGALLIAECLADYYRAEELEYFTPDYVVFPIMKRLKAGAVVWCPFDTAESAFVRVLSAHGFCVIYGHIRTGQDFFTSDVPDCDYIVSNPPYSLKDTVLKRLYEIGKPFAMLINFQGIFDQQKRFQMFKENRVEMLWLSPRVNYIAENGQLLKGAPFQSGYLCSGICENQLEFEYLARSVSCP